MICQECFHRILHLWSLLYYTCSYPVLPLVFYSTSLLLLSYHIISWVVPAWYHLLYIYLLLYACAHDTIFDALLWFGFIDTRVLIFTRHLALASPLVREFPLPWILMSRSQSLELVDSPNYWIERCNGSVDLQQTVQSPILPGPLCVSRFVLFILVYLLAFSQLRLTVM